MRLLHVGRSDIDLTHDQCYLASWSALPVTQKELEKSGGGGGGLLEENYWKLEEDTLWNCLVSPLE